jgi:hypothetical protein
LLRYILIEGTEDEDAEPIPGAATTYNIIMGTIVCAMCANILKIDKWERC